MIAHTPGPLFVSDGAHADGAVDYAVYVEIDGKRQIVAEFFGTAGHGTKFDSKSNARLYAAAPDLLEALKALVAWADVERPDGSLAPAALAHAVIERVEADK